jgi:hypothetical protein
MSGPGSPVAAIEIQPPESIVIGRGNAVVIAGHCYHPRERLRGLEVDVNGSRQPVERFGLPRVDLYESLDPGDPARPQAYRSGFVTVADLAPIDAPRRLEIELVLTLADGAEAKVPAASIDARPELEAPP